MIRLICYHSAMSTTTTVYVDTIHLNIGVGDCSIVCKLRKGVKAKAKPILTGAVLIDGGFATAAGIIKKCLTEQLPKLYDVETDMDGKGKVILDAVVITHWDKDHYGGIINLIRNDLKEQSKDKSRKEIESLRCSFFRQHSVAPDIPFTTMYVPYWDIGSGSQKSTPLTRLTRNNPGPFSTSYDTMDFDLVDKGNDHLWVKDLCRLSSSWQQNLGQNLFNGLGPTLDKDLTSPLNLAMELTKEIGRAHV